MYSTVLYLRKRHAQDFPFHIGPMSVCTSRMVTTAIGPPNHNHLGPVSSDAMPLSLEGRVRHPWALPHNVFQTPGSAEWRSGPLGDKAAGGTELRINFPRLGDESDCLFQAKTFGIWVSFLH
jgi:hypothetical protein